MIQMKLVLFKDFGWILKKLERKNLTKLSDRTIRITIELLIASGSYSLCEFENIADTEYIK